MNICTYFDSNYLLKGSVCLYTILANNPKTMVYLICLDDEILKFAEQLNKNIIPIPLAKIEEYCPQLLKVKGQRTQREYYATMTPIIPLYIFDTYGIGRVFYTDADMGFFSDPVAISDTMGTHSFMVTDHGLEPPYPTGRFNVGILGYRNDEHCRNFLNWWRDKCLDWCKWEVRDDGACADQGYLNILHNKPGTFKNYLSCPHQGINLGPWSLKNRKVEKRGDKLFVCGKELVCYHFHGFSYRGKTYDPSGWAYSDSDCKLLFDPYFELTKKAENKTLF